MPLDPTHPPQAAVNAADDRHARVLNVVQTNAPVRTREEHALLLDFFSKRLQEGKASAGCGRLALEKLCRRVQAVKANGGTKVARRGSDKHIIVVLKGYLQLSPGATEGRTRPFSAESHTSKRGEGREVEPNAGEMHKAAYPPLAVARARHTGLVKDKRLRELISPLRHNVSLAVREWYKGGDDFAYTSLHDRSKHSSPKQPAPWLRQRKDSKDSSMDSVDLNQAAIQAAAAGTSGSPGGGGGGSRRGSTGTFGMRSDDGWEDCGVPSAAPSVYKAGDCLLVEEEEEVLGGGDLATN